MIRLVEVLSRRHALSNRNTAIAELSAFIRAINAYRLLAHRAAAEQLALSLTDLRCLDAIRTIPELTPSRLAAVLGLSAPATTTALDRLEQQGLVKRTRDKVDRRRVYLTSTGQHETRTARLFEPLTLAATEVLADYTDPQLVVLAGLLRKLTQASNTLIQEEAAKPTQNGNHKSQ